MHGASDTTAEADIRNAALAYAALGWSVIPVEARAKRPLVRWQEFQRRRASAAQLRAWFRRWPQANVGIVTGKISGLVVMDVDPAHGGADSLARLERLHGALPPTVEAASGGGRHLYFRHPDRDVPNRVGLAAGIDLRGDGGLVVAPPSLHPSGRRYRWVRAPGAQALAPLPRWLLEAATVPGQHGGGGGHPLEYWRRLVHEGVPEGRRNTTLASLAGHLLRHEVDPEVVLELLLAWNRLRCRPPLADDEVVRVVESISRRHRRRTESETGRKSAE